MKGVFLKIPIFVLYNFQYLNDINFNVIESNAMKDRYNLEERSKIHEDLVWAENNPNYDFKSIMNDAPVVGKLSFSNKEIYNYLMDFKAFMENEEYGLLIEDKPTIF